MTNNAILVEDGFYIRCEINGLRTGQKYQHQGDCRWDNNDQPFQWWKLHGNTIIWIRIARRQSLRTSSKFNALRNNKSAGPVKIEQLYERNNLFQILLVWSWPVVVLFLFLDLYGLTLSKHYK